MTVAGEEDGGASGSVCVCVSACGDGFGDGGGVWGDAVPSSTVRQHVADRADRVWCCDGQMDVEMW